MTRARAPHARKRSPRYGEAGYRRIPNDAYDTQAWMTRTLLDFWRPRGEVWECAAGANWMVRELRRVGLKVWATDLKPRAPGIQVLDFLDGPGPWQLNGPVAIATNPPFSTADDFVAMALASTRPVLGQVAMLLRHEWDCPRSRRPFFADCRAYAFKLTMHERPWFTGSRTNRPRDQFAWYVWDWLNHEPARVVYA